jgi:hypothetical protein
MARPNIMQVGVESSNVGLLFKALQASQVC